MKSSDKRIILILGGVIALGALWFGLISPKRAALGELDSQVAEKQTLVSQQEAVASTAATAKEDYESDYRELITLGKAVPADDDTSSLIDQIDGLAGETGVDFIGLQLSQGAAGAAPAPPPEAPAGEAPPEGEGEAPATPTAAPATETSAADLPLGATVGPAGLPVMPYDLTFRGTFFELADFLAGIDDMVRTNPSGITVDGRLLTVSGFELQPDEDRGFPELSVNLNVTSYVAPADQGATGGATPAAPVPGAATPAEAPPAASTTPAPTAAVTP